MHCDGMGEIILVKFFFAATICNYIVYLYNIRIRSNALSSSHWSNVADNLFIVMQ